MVGLFSNAIVLPVLWNNCYTNVKMKSMGVFEAGYERPGCNMGFILTSCFGVWAMWLMRGCGSGAGGLEVETAVLVVSGGVATMLVDLRVLVAALVVWKLRQRCWWFWGVWRRH